MATARDVVPGSGVLSRIRTLTPSRLSHRARTRPVGPAPTIRTRRSAIDLFLESKPSKAPWRAFYERILLGAGHNEYGRLNAHRLRCIAVPKAANRNGNWNSEW